MCAFCTQFRCPRRIPRLSEDRKGTRAPLTVAAYTTDIGQFAAFLEKHKRTLLNCPAQPRARIYPAAVWQCRRWPFGRTEALGAASLYRYLLLDKMIEHDPTLNIDSPKQWKVLPKALARDEMESMLALRMRRRTSKEAASDSGARPCHAGSFLCGGAARVRNRRRQTGRPEARSGCLLVRGKGDKERIVPLGKGAQDALDRLHEGGAPGSGEREELRRFYSWDAAAES